MESTIHPFFYPKYFMNTDLSDFQIHCEGEIFPCHTVILKKRSKYFKAMFESGFKETIEGEMVIKGAKAKDVKTMLQFIYMQQIPTELATVELIILGDRFDLQELIKCTISRLINKLRHSDDEVMKALKAFETPDKVKIAINIIEALKELERRHIKDEKFFVFLQNRFLDVVKSIEDLELEKFEFATLALKIIKAMKIFKVQKFPSKIQDNPYFNYIRYELLKKRKHAMNMIFEIMNLIDFSMFEEFEKAVFENILNVPNTMEFKQYLYHPRPFVTMKDLKDEMCDLLLMIKGDVITTDDLKTFMKCIKKENVPNSSITLGLKKLAYHSAGMLALDEKMRSFIQDLLPGRDIANEMLEALYLPPEALGVPDPYDDSIFTSPRVFPNDGSIRPQDAEAFLQVMKKKYVPPELASNGLIALGKLSKSSHLVKGCKECLFAKRKHK